MRTTYRRRRGATPRVGARRGFTLVELIVGMMLLVVGVMGLVGVSVFALRQSSSADRQSAAASVAASRMEQLRSRSCAAITGGTATTRDVQESWVVVGTSATTRRVRGTFIYKKPSGAPVTTLTVETTIQC